MDREQEEMQFLGLWGIYRESYKIIISYRKLLTQITLALILPLSFLLLANIEVSDLLSSKIKNNAIQFDHTPKGDTKRRNRLSDLVSSEEVTLLLFKLVYWILFLVFSLLSTSAVVYTIASVYTARHVSFRKVMSVVPKVWKRLMVTFLCTFLVFVACFVVFVVSLVVVAAFTVVLDLPIYKVYLPTVIVLLVIYAAGSVYLAIVWQLANVVSVLEDFKGFKAMGRSKDLIKGKMWVAAFIFFMLNSSVLAIKWLFESFVAHRGDSTPRGPLIRVWVGLLCFLLLIKLFLFGLVVKTVFYLVCKSYHHENIDKSTLSDHLEVYLGEYVPLKTKDVQLESFDF